MTIGNVQEIDEFEALGFPNRGGVIDRTCILILPCLHGKGYFPMVSEVLVITGDNSLISMSAGQGRCITLACLRIQDFSRNFKQEYFP